MANDINRVCLIGRLTRDPELKFTPTNTPIASFSIANNKSWKAQNGEKKENCSFFNCIAWGKTGEIIAQYFKKGQRIIVEGRLQQRSWDDKDGNRRSVVEVVVENFQFLDAPAANKESVTASQEQTAAEPENVPSFEDCSPAFSDDDVPF